MRTLSNNEQRALRSAKFVTPTIHTPYAFEDKCIFEYRGITYADFEHLQRYENMLQINHFSVHERYRGARIGEECLRRFANYVGGLDASIEAIEFALYRGPTNANHSLIADKRLDLLMRLGVCNPVKKPEANNRFTVSGIWLRNDWAKP